MKGYQQHIAATQRDLQRNLQQHKKNIITNFSEQEFLAITLEAENIIKEIEQARTFGVSAYEDLLNACKIILQTYENSSKQEHLSDEWNNNMSQTHQEVIVKIIQIIENI